MKSLGVNWQKKIVFVCSLLLLTLNSCSRSVPVVPEGHKNAPAALKKIFPGKVTFSGLTEELLQDILAVSENFTDFEKVSCEEGNRFQEWRS